MVKKTLSSKKMSSHSVKNYHKSNMSKFNSSRAFAHNNNTNVIHDYCINCHCKVDIINIKHSQLKGKGYVQCPCLIGM